VLEAAQRLRRRWRSLDDGDDDEYDDEYDGDGVVDGGFGGGARGGGGGARGDDLATVVGWRGLMQIAVAWRQLSEPHDPVFWVDQMTWHAFDDGFGLQTPLVSERAEARANASARSSVAAAAAIGDGTRVIA